jgi:dolichyl-phosphate beta-glucosyltransferase
MTSDTPFLSVIIPAYNEEKRIQDTLDTVFDYLRCQSYSSEVIVVDDGSRDQTVQVCQASLAGVANARLITYQPNRGKGYAVRQGMLASKGQVALFTDADLSTPVAEIEIALKHLESGDDIVIGSRAIAGVQIGKYQPLYRRIGSRVFNLLRDGIVGVGISRFKDTQCGFKVFHGELARDLFRRLTVDGFMFDVELLYIAIRLGCRIYEQPIRWTDMPGSKLRFVRDTLRMFKDLAMIRLGHRQK